MPSPKTQKRVYNSKRENRKYRRYPLTTRLKLIHMVEQEGKSLYFSAKVLKICQTSARLIMSTWKKEKRVFEKKTDKKKRLERTKKREEEKREKERRRMKAKKARRVPEAPEPQVKLEPPESPPLPLPLPPRVDQALAPLPFPVPEGSEVVYMVYENVVSPFGFVVPLFVHPLILPRFE